MKNLTILKSLLVIVLLGMGATTFAQVSTPVGTLYVEGGNSTLPAGPVATETPDLITIGTTVPYLVIPDANLNTGWAAAAAAGSDYTVTTGITSTWTWTIPGTISATVPGTGHYITIVGLPTGVAGTTGNITVQEIGACDGSTEQIAVRLAAQPAATALAVSDGAAPLDATCGGTTNGTLDIALPTFTVTQTTDAAIPGDATVRVKATLVFTDLVTGTSTTLFTDAVLNVNEATGVISNADMTAAAAVGAYDDLDSWGTYVLTTSSISDKISRKDINVADGYFAAVYTDTYTVNKPPVTGAIYHISNE